MLELNWHARERFMATARQVVQPLPPMERGEFLELAEALTRAQDALDGLRDSLNDSQVECRELRRDNEVLEGHVDRLEAELAKAKGEEE